MTWTPLYVVVPLYSTSIDKDTSGILHLFMEKGTPWSSQYLWFPGPRAGTPLVTGLRSAKPLNHSVISIHVISFELTCIVIIFPSSINSILKSDSACNNGDIITLCAAFKSCYAFILSVPSCSI